MQSDSTHLNRDDESLVNSKDWGALFLWEYGHLVPENCGALRVGNEERPWVEGKMLIFDDSMEHEAWNTSDEERVVLLFEIWRPELNDAERGLITSMLVAVKEYYS